ncbi:MAG: tRNA (adenosine(37)-N6)-threonylcarbamoyltransferase complex ATPase subunit type 1 TsaE [Ginsengibacter sp.]
MELDFEIGEIDSVAKRLLAYSAGYKIITFNGELGAGKTTLINALCKALGVKETVTSPTYSLVHEYPADSKEIIYHMDLYRLKSQFEAVDAGLEEYISSGNYCMIEWPSIIESILPLGFVKCELQVLGTQMRKLVVQLPQ